MSSINGHSNDSQCRHVAPTALNSSTGRHRYVIAGGALVLLITFQLIGSAISAPTYGPINASSEESFPQCDPMKVVTAEACARCHVMEAQVWRNTPHHQTFYQLHRSQRAREIAGRLGIRSIKRNDLCAQCHFTRQQSEGIRKTVAGVSCESCHGAGRDWVQVHNDYGGPGVSRAAEGRAHRRERIERSIELGMRNPRNAYLIARSCLNCHTVPHETLVNVGGHVAGSADFELVAWSQGQVRHNFLRSGGQQNVSGDISRLRMLYVAGLIADLEFSTRAVAIATDRNRFGVESARRAARVAQRLYDLQQGLQHPLIQSVLEAFAAAELRTNNRQSLMQVADQVRDLGIRLAAEESGHDWAAVDALLPSAAEYR